MKNLTYWKGALQLQQQLLRAPGCTGRHLAERIRAINFARRKVAFLESIALKTAVRTFLVACVLLLHSCSTVSGIGKDIQDLSDGVRDKMAERGEE